jgi:hypothetical protein
MRAHFKLPSIDREDLDAKPPIEVKFEIPYFTTSGIQVKQLIPHLFIYIFVYSLGTIFENH